MSGKRILTLMIVVAMLFTFIPVRARATTDAEVTTMETESEEIGYDIIEYEDLLYKIPRLSLNREPGVTESGYVEKITEVPQYFQTYYPNLIYGNTSVRSGGCGIACLSMVLTYLTDEEVTIEELVKKYNGYKTSDGSDYGLFNNTASDYGLTVKQVWEWKSVVEALENGQVVVATPNSKTHFSNGGHFIVLFGITKEGRILVRDPNLSNYSIWNYSEREDGYANGFQQKSIKYNCFPMWIYEAKDLEAIAARVEAEELNTNTTEVEENS